MMALKSSINVLILVSLLSFAVENAAATNEEITSPNQGRKIFAEAYKGVGPLDMQELSADFSARREVAWRLSQLIIAPAQQQSGFGYIFDSGYASVWQTWYSRDDIKNLLGEINASQPLTASGLTPEASKRLLSAVNREQVPNFDPAPFNGGFQLFSPAVYNEDYVLHILQNFRHIATCPPITSKVMDEIPENESSHSNCMKEFPEKAVMMKLAWGEADKVDENGRYYEEVIKDLGESGMRNVLERGQGWLDGELHRLDKTNAYTMTEVRSGKQFVLKGFHIVTKELRDWVWVSFIWQPNPNEGLGSDRPDFIHGVYQNYVMTVVVNELELDPQPGLGINGKPLFSNLDAPFKRYQNKNQVITWSSNPFIEGPDSTSNCISCHQGQFATGKFGPHSHRKHFPYDYTFGTQNAEPILMPRVSFRDDINIAALRVASD